MKLQALVLGTLSAFVLVASPAEAAVQTTPVSSSALNDSTLQANFFKYKKFRKFKEYKKFKKFHHHHHG